MSNIRHSDKAQKIIGELHNEPEPIHYVPAPEPVAEPVYQPKQEPEHPHPKQTPGTAPLPPETKYGTIECPLIIKTDKGDYQAVVTVRIYPDGGIQLEPIKRSAILRVIHWD